LPAHATLHIGYYRLDNRHLNSTLVGDLTLKVINARRDLTGEQPAIPHDYRCLALAHRPLTRATKGRHRSKRRRRTIVIN